MVEPLCEEEGRGLGEDFTGAFGSDRGGKSQAFRHEGVVAAGFQEGDVAGVGSHAFDVVGGLLGQGRSSGTKEGGEGGVE